MKNESLPETQLEFERLSAEVFSLQRDPGCTAGQAEILKQTRLPADPEFAAQLEALFQRTPQGKKEWLRMQTDALRRVSRSRETEQLFRAFGVLELVTPVRIGNRLVHAIFSGPLKVTPWTPQEKETLAKICGLSVRDLPSGLEDSAIFGPRQIQYLLQSQSLQAGWISRCLTSVQESGDLRESALPSTLGLELLQPGFADHLDLLFSSLQKELRGPEPLPAESMTRIEAVARRGRHLVSQIRNLSQETLQPAAEVSVHSILEQWTSHFSRHFPSLQIRPGLNAEKDRIHASPSQLQHMLFTLMASVADGLPEAQAVMGLNTRNVMRDGREFLHVEIRDSGGLATFAGVGGEVDRTLAREEQEASLEFADWFTLASHMDAELLLLRDEDVVTRAELFLPLETVFTEPVPGRQLWIVEDNDQDYESLLHMLQQKDFQCTRFCSAAELQKNFPLAVTPPDLVVLKYYLPDQRGAEVRVWLYEQDPSLPVILISGLQATHPGIATANSLPSTLYLQKPFDSQDLLDMVHMNLEDTLPG